MLKTEQGCEVDKGRLNRALIFLVMTMIFLAGQTTCFAESVTLSWDANTESNLAGYKVYYKADSSSLPFNGTGAVEGASPVDIHKQTTATISGLDPGRTYYFAVTAYNTSGIESTYSNLVTILESVPPAVTLSSPANNATVSGTVSVTASVSDNVGVTKTEFYVNGVLQFTDTTSPYLYSWNTSLLAAGTYSLMGKVYDAAGNSGTSATVAVKVIKDTTVPTVSLTAPANNATVSGKVTITASASDNVGLSSLVIYLNGTPLVAGNVSPLSFTWDTTSVANGTYTLVAKAYDTSDNVSSSAGNVVTVSNGAASSSNVNVALASNGGVATASSTYSGPYGNFPVQSVNNGERKGVTWGAGGGWNDDTANIYPDWVQITFNGQKTIGEIDVYTLQDSLNNPIEPTPNQSFSLYGITSFDVQYWNGSAWVTVPGGSITGNNLVWRKITFPPVATDRIRVVVNASMDGASRITEIEAFTSVTTVSDTTSPTVSITAPSSGSSVNGTVAITASASDNVGVSKVEFYVNSVLQAADTSSPYTFSWNTVSLVNGSYTLLAKAYDAANNIGTSSSVTVTVNNDKTAPIVSLTTPSSGATVSGTVAVTASASDNVGVSRVEFYVNSVLQATVTSAPYTFSWNTASLVNGSYTLLAKAYDAANNIGTSSSVTVTVNNDKTAPTVSLTAPSSGATVSGTVAVAASASDNVGVSKVEFYVNSILQASDTNSPYTFTWNTSSLTNGTYTLLAKAYDASGNVGTSTSNVVTVSNSAASSSNVNVALASNGGVATASSTYSGPYGNFPVQSVNNGDRKGLNWGAGGGWNDDTANSYPDWVQITFNSQKSISEIDVYTLQDSYDNPIEPTQNQSFSLYGITSFDVQYWNGSVWVTVPGGSITGNNLVWRKITFSPVATDRIRVVVNATLDGASRITEIEAFTN